MTGARWAIRLTSVALAGVLLFLAGWRLGMRRALEQSGVPVPTSEADYGAIEPFQVTDQLGRPTTLDTFRGQTWVADFIFTRCAGPCPVVSGQMKQLAADFNDKKNLRFVSFTVDPAYDQPPVLKAYAERFGANPERWRFVTGPADDVHRLIRQSFHVAAEPLPAGEKGEVNIMHSLYFVLVNGEGRIAGVYDSTDPAAVARLRTELERLS